ncbi:MAG: DUF1761 domain-containing protein [Bacteroidetes bacterium]|nr:DUF1761 domain-containing protein [Bacteroidota bacterium]
MDTVQFYWGALVVAVLANFIFGAVWYMPLFGKAWAKEMGFSMDQKPPASVMIRGMLIGVIGGFLLAYVFAHNIAAWACVKGMGETSAMSKMLMSAIFTWLGFYVPVDLNGIAWERKSWKLFFINTAYHLLSLVLVASVFIFWQNAVSLPCNS